MLQDSAREARAYQRQASREQDAVELDALRKTMQVTEMPPAEIAKMRERGKSVADKYGRELDQELVAGLQAELDKARAGR